MPKVLHLIPTVEGGGAERQLAMLAAEQSKRGWDVHVGLRRGGVHEDQMRSSGVAIHWLGDLKGVHPLLIARVTSLVRRIRPHLVQTWLPQMDVVGGLAALWNSVPWLLNERASKEAYQRMAILAPIRYRLARFSKAVVANSVEGADYWKRMLPEGKAVFTVANAVDIGAIRGVAPILCKDAGEQEPTLLFVGRLAPQKAPEIFIEALMHVAKLQAVRGLLIGDGPLGQQIRYLIRKQDLEDRVRILPYQANWWGLLKTATALVSPSRFEGQPNVVLEAMAAGCPLIVSDIPTHRAILDEQSALILPKDDPKNLARAILLLLSDQKAARERAERASKRVNGFTIQSTADAYEYVYSGLITTRSA